MSEARSALALLLMALVAGCTEPSGHPEVVARRVRLMEIGIQPAGPGYAWANLVLETAEPALGPLDRLSVVFETSTGDLEERLGPPGGFGAAPAGEPIPIVIPLTTALARGDGMIWFKPGSELRVRYRQPGGSEVLRSAVMR